jgi:CRISPR-associated protein Csh1
MMVTSILDDIKHDETDKNGFSKHGPSIKKKLSIWFNFWDYFSNNQNRKNMADTTLEVIERLKSLIKNNDDHFLKQQDDDAFAFASGQLISKILIQSKSANRSHALLEPFLQKANAIEFKRAIANAFNIYKHEFKMYSKKYQFDKFMSEVLGYEPKEKNMKNLIHMVLAGYFAESLL